MMEFRRSGMRRWVVVLAVFLYAGSAAAQVRYVGAVGGEDALTRGFQQPPASAKLRCYWWWLNGHTTKEAITRDLTEMAAKGYGGVLLVDANGANQTGNNPVPAGPEFGSPEWVTLYRHALDEAGRLGLEVTLNITSGWNLGSPATKAEMASKVLTFSRATVAAGATEVTLPAQPAAKLDFYRQIAVLAYPLHAGVPLPGAAGSGREGIAKLAFKASMVEAGFSMPDTTPLLGDNGVGFADGVPDMAKGEVIDITASFDAKRHSSWRPPAASKDAWEILRVGFTASGAKVSTSSGAWQGLAIDYLDPKALDQYWAGTVAPLLTAAGPDLGKSLKYVATDSWELGGTNWTYQFREEFTKRRGYDPVPYLPVVAGRIEGSREESQRFLADLRRTVADLVTEHYDHMAALAGAHGLGIQCESGGPHGAPIDALETFRKAAVVQTEYWAMSPEHRSTDPDRYFVKEASSAAHIYGKPLVAAEGMTTIGNQWNESLDMNLKPSFDMALTEGLNRLVWHEFTSSPPELGLPGQEYFAGTHLNPNVTWWQSAGPFLTYLNRAQFLMQQGKSVSDVLYYYGDNTPNFARLKMDDPAKALPGFDYDVTDTDALLGRMKPDGTLLKTPEGVAYRVFALPVSRVLPLEVLQFAVKYAEAGGTIVGLRPLRSAGIVDVAAQRQFDALVEKVWGPCEKSAEHRSSVGQGQIFCESSTHEAMQAMGIEPDFDADASALPSLDYVHRQLADGGHIYFIRNTKPTALRTKVMLRAAGRQPEIFDAVTGEVQPTMLFSMTQDGRTKVPLVLEPYGSVFLVFRRQLPSRQVVRVERDGKVLFASSSDAGELPAGLSVVGDGQQIMLEAAEAGTYVITLRSGSGEHTERVLLQGADSVPLTAPWMLRFPPKWGAPAEVKVDTLKSWTEFDDVGVRYFSGTGTYTTTVTLSAAQAKLPMQLDVGAAHEVVRVQINGGAERILWKRPFTVEAQGLHAGANTIQVQVTNLWPNRLIGDAQPHAMTKYTWTNITKWNKDSPLLPSGLVGPVRLVPVYRSAVR